MSLLQVLQTRESLLEVLSQEQDALTHVDDLLFSDLCCSRHLNDEVIGNQLHLLKLLCDLHRHVKRTDGLKTGTTTAQLVVVQGHFRQINTKSSDK